MLKSRTVGILSSMCCTLCLSAVVSASDISGTIFLIEAEVAGESNTFAVPFASGTTDAESHSWQLADPMPLISDGFELGTLDGAQRRVHQR